MKNQFLNKLVLDGASVCEVIFESFAMLCMLYILAFTHTNVQIAKLAFPVLLAEDNIVGVKREVISQHMFSPSLSFLRLSFAIFVPLKHCTHL
jgi:hypothetical protein